MLVRYGTMKLLRFARRSRVVCRRARLCVYLNVVLMMMFELNIIGVCLCLRIMCVSLYLYYKYSSTAQHQERTTSLINVRVCENSCEITASKQHYIYTYDSRRMPLRRAHYTFSAITAPRGN